MVACGSSWYAVVPWDAKGHVGMSRSMEDPFATVDFHGPGSTEIHGFHWKLKESSRGT
jgi:hypothetical protein